MRPKLLPHRFQIFRTPAGEAVAAVWIDGSHVRGTYALSRVTHEDFDSTFYGPPFAIVQGLHAMYAALRLYGCELRFYDDTDKLGLEGLEERLVLPKLYRITRGSEGA